MRRLLLLLLLVLTTVSPALAGHKPPKIIFRVYIQTSGEGLPGTLATQIQIPPDNETIMIRSMPEVTEHDLLGVQSDASGAIHFHLNHSGQVALSAATGQNQGKIMVVTLNGIVYYSPIIDEQISTGELIIPHPLDAATLQALQEVAAANTKQANRR